MKALISIILPVYKVEKYIAKALVSCIKQSFKDIEIIVVDDCGNDKSIKIAQQYAKKDSRIKILYNNENLKLLRVRYEGVKIASSDYIMFLDPDDYLSSYACEKAFEFMSKEAPCILFFNATLHPTLNLRKFDFPSGSYLAKDFIKCICERKNLYWTMWGKLIRKDLYLDSFASLNLDKNTKINMAEDALIYYALMNKAKKIGYLDKNLYHYNNNADSISNIQDKIVILSNIKEQYLVLSLLRQNCIVNKHNKLLYFLIKYLLLIQIYKIEGKNINKFFIKLNILFSKMAFKMSKVFLRKH